MERTVSNSSRTLRSSHLENHEFLALKDQNKKNCKKNKKESLKNKNKMDEALEAPYIDYELDNLESDNSSTSSTNLSEESKDCEKNNNSIISNSSMKESIIIHNEISSLKNTINNIENILPEMI